MYYTAACLFFACVSHQVERLNEVFQVTLVAHTAEVQDLSELYNLAYVLQIKHSPSAGKARN